MSLITDIHTHILPDIDDGPKDTEQTMALLQAFAALEVDRIISTSHLDSPYFRNSDTELRQAFQTLLSSHLNPPEVQLGAEIHLGQPFPGIHQFESFIPLGASNYVLLEFPNHAEVTSIAAWTHEFKIRGYHPIVAHPERNLVFQRKPRLIKELVEHDVMIQLTASCFIEQLKPEHEVQRLAKWILEQGMASFMASDAHNTSTRPPNLTTAYNHLELRYGTAVVDGLISNANAVWCNESKLAIATITP